MSKFNTKMEAVKAPKRVVNEAGGVAYAQGLELELVSLMVTSFVQNKFYRKEEVEVARLRELVDTIKDKEFIAKAAVHIRKVWGMRSITHLCAAFLAPHIRGQEWAKSFYRQIVDRPDDMLEITAAWKAQVNGGKLHPYPHAMRKGFGAALLQMNDYQLAKYGSAGKEITLRDMVNLCRPKPVGEQQIARFKAFMDGTLAPAETWEVKLSQAGQQENKDEAKAEVWEQLLKEQKLGYLALVRNLVNIAKQAPDMVPEAIHQLIDPERVKHGRVFPFQYLTATKAVTDAFGSRQDILEALTRAIEVACTVNLPDLPGRTLVMVDGSGSMDSDRIDKTAALYAAVFIKSLGAECLMFSNKTKFIPVLRGDSLMGLANQISGAADHGGTDMQAPWMALTREYTRVIVLSDMMGWIGSYGGNSLSDTARLAYEHKTGAKPYVYAVDLTGSGTMQFSGDRLLALAGFSSEMFSIMEALEQDRDALVNSMKQVEW